MIFFFILILLIIIGFTSKNKFLSIAAKSLAAGLFIMIPSSCGLMIACQAKKLPWGFCGDFTGFINIFFTATLISLGVMAITGFILWKKR